MGVAKNVSTTTKTFISVLSLGLVGLLFLIIFGNLSGNLGFGDDSTNLRVDNESGVVYINATNYTLAVVNGSTSNYVIVNVWNETSANLVDSGFYGVTDAGVVWPENGTSYPHEVNITYTYDYATPSTGKQNTNEVILNLTGGAVTFFGFANVWFVLLAITLLIIIVISVIKIVSGSGGMKGEGSSTFPT